MNRAVGPVNSVIIFFLSQAVAHSLGSRLFSIAAKVLVDFLKPLELSSDSDLS